MSSTQEVANALGAAVASVFVHLVELARGEPLHEPEATNGGTPDRPLKAEEAPDRLLKAEEAAEILGVSRSYFYGHRDLPFVVNIPPNALRVSERGLRRWIKERMGGTQSVATMPSPPRPPKVETSGNGVMPDWAKR